MAYASTKIERVSSNSTSCVMRRSLAIDDSAGATIEEETGEMKVKQETTTVAAHFLRMLQFLGFAGSSGESHVTFAIELSLIRALKYGQMGRRTY